MSKICVTNVIKVRVKVMVGAGNFVLPGGGGGGEEGGKGGQGRESSA